MPRDSGNCQPAGPMAQELRNCQPAQNSPDAIAPTTRNAVEYTVDWQCLLVGLELNHLTVYTEGSCDQTPQRGRRRLPVPSKYNDSPHQHSIRSTSPFLVGPEPVKVPLSILVGRVVCESASASIGESSMVSSRELIIVRQKRERKGVGGIKLSSKG